MSGFSYPNNAQVRGDFLYVRDSDGNILSGHRVDDGDYITVLDVSYSKQLVKVEYPTANGVRTGYVKNATNLIYYFHEDEWKNGSTKEIVYDKTIKRSGQFLRTRQQLCFLRDQMACMPLYIIQTRVKIQNPDL